MRRQDRYPDTRYFHYHNENPHHRITGDCVIRAVALATRQTWEGVARALTETAIKTGYGPTDKECVDRYLQSIGWTKHRQPRKLDNTKYTGEEFCEALNRGLITVWGDTIVAKIGGHHQVCIKYEDGLWKVWDIWDSTDGCIGNWWAE